MSPDFSFQVPVIETERLLLRGHRLEDFAPCAAMWADPLVTRHIGGQPFSAEESWSRLLRYAGHWAMLGYGYWMVEEKSTGAFAGEVGFADYHRSLTPPLPAGPETGWVLASAFHGKGYATEAVRASLQWGDAKFALNETNCIIHPENLGSIRVALKCGYTETAPRTYKGQPVTAFIRRGATCPTPAESPPPPRAP